MSEIDKLEADFEKRMAEIKGKLNAYEETAKSEPEDIEKHRFLAFLGLFKRVVSGEEQIFKGFFSMIRNFESLVQMIREINQKIEDISKRVSRLEEEFEGRQSMR